MKEKLQELKQQYEFKVKFLDDEIYDCENEKQEIRMLSEQKAYRKFVSELEEILLT